jgi:hypothetical protein
MTDVLSRRIRFSVAAVALGLTLGFWAPAPVQGAADCGASECAMDDMCYDEGFIKDDNLCSCEAGCMWIPIGRL